MVLRAIRAIRVFRVTAGTVEDTTVVELEAALVCFDGDGDGLLIQGIQEASLVT